MNIILNNTPETIDEKEISIAQLLILKNFIFKMLVIKVNEQVVKKLDYETTFVKDGDNVVVLHLVSGG
jgi:thiamine biosynthesis protein ThiS